MKKVYFNEFGVMSTMFLCAAADTENPGCKSADDFSKPNAEIMKEIEKEEQERELQEKKNAAKNQLQKDRYEQERDAIELRYQRAKEKAEAKKLKARTEENNKYNAGGVDTEEHKANIQKIREEYSRDIDTADNERSKALSNLRDKNPEGYRRSDSRW